MEQTTQKATRQPRNKANDAANGQTITKMITVKEGEESPIIHAFDLSNFVKGIGAMVSKVQGKATFEFLGKKFIVPSLTANNSNPERAAAIFKQLVANVFPAANDRTEILKDGSEEYNAVISLQKAGFKFKTVSKVAVKEAIDIKLKNWRAKMNVQKEETRSLNVSLIAETKVLNETVKGLRADNLTALTGFQQKAVKQLTDETLPAN